MRFALEHQNPLATGIVTGGTSYPESSYSFLAISDPNVLLWALKPAEDGMDQGIVVRLWNLAAQPANGTLALAVGPIAQGWHTTHLETPIEEATVVDGELVISLGAHQIKTWSVPATNSGWSALSAPTGVAASDGTYANHVRISWNAVTRATTYEVWRNTSNDPNSAMRIASSVSGTMYGDTAAAPEQIYYYWVKARNFYSTSEFSVPDSGWKRLPLPTDTWIYLPLIKK